MRRKRATYDLVELKTGGKKDVRTTAVVGAVVLLHLTAVLSGVFFIQGCAAPAPKPVAVEPPPSPIMPPTKVPSAPPTHTVFQPPVPVEPAPAVLEPGAGETYAIQKGDSLSKIASRFGVSWRELAEINNISDPHKIRVGQKLVLPSHASATGRASAPPKSPASAPSLSGSTYVVQAGDSISKIASRLGVKISDLAAANNLSDPNRIRVGQTLTVPGAGSAASAAPIPPASEAPALETGLASDAEALLTESFPAAESAAPAVEKPLDYTVLTGDTLDGIAKLFIVSKEEVMKLNNLASESDVKPGMKILIPPPDI